MLPTERPSYDLAHRGKPSSSTQAQPNRNPFPPFESQGIIQNHIYIQDHLNLRPFTREYGQPHSNPPNPPQRSQTDFQRIPAPNDHDPLNRLKLFDTKFIVDDTGSMNLSIDQSNPYARSRWDVTVEALGHIAEIAARYDEDGIDIRFLKEQKLDEDRITSGDRVRELLGKIDVDTHSGGTEFQDQLEEALDPHLEKYGEYLRQKADSKQNAHRDSGIRAPKRPKSLNLIVITDGEADDEQEVEEYIVSVAKRLDDWDAPAAYVGIQFVQVGDDARATIFLQRLDDELKNREPHIRRDVSIFSLNDFYISSLPLPPLPFNFVPNTASRSSIQSPSIALSAWTRFHSLSSWRRKSSLAPLREKSMSSKMRSGHEKEFPFFLFLLLFSILVL